MKNRTKCTKLKKLNKPNEDTKSCKIIASGNQMIVYYNSNNAWLKEEQRDRLQWARHWIGPIGI